MEGRKRFALATLVTSALLVGFLGFGLGFNFNQLSNYFKERLEGSRPSQLPPDLDYGEVEEVYDSLREHFAGSLDAGALIEGAKKGLVEAGGDPNTVYLDAEAARQFQAGLDGTFSGIGAEIAMKNERLVVVAPLAGSPAKQAGLRANDDILAIDGETTLDMKVEEAVAKIRGSAGSVVKLKIGRGSKEFEVAITRANIEVPSLNSELKNGDIGYIRLVRFSADTAGKLRESATNLIAKGAKKFIIDLRDNPGGLLSAAVEVTDEFLDVGQTVVEERKDTEVIETFRSTAGGSLIGKPVVVLLNEGSASASEIVAGALKDHKLATIIGEPSFGKGSVQELVELSDETWLKVTIALWYTPKGININQDGIEPDIRIDLTQEDFNKNSDPQLERALLHLR